MLCFGRQQLKVEQVGIKGGINGGFECLKVGGKLPSVRRLFVEKNPAEKPKPETA